MAKSRRKKNYKLRRRVMRTVAALTMVMAIVVAAIPVENYGTMRAAVLERSPWDTENENAYPSEIDESTGSVTFSGYDHDRTIQEVRDGYLQDIVEVAAKNSNSGADAILTGFPSTISSPSLDVRENMFYNYKIYTADEIDTWVKKLQNNNEKFEFKYNYAEGRTITHGTGDGSTVKLPGKFDTSSAGNFDSESFGWDADEPNGLIAANASSFGVEKVFSGSGAFFGGQYDTYTANINAYNEQVRALEDIQITDATTDAEWEDFKSEVQRVEALYDNLNNDVNVENQTLTIKINEGLEFSLNTTFYVESFCNRVQCDDPNISLQGFTLEILYRSTDDSTTTEDVYVVKWNQESRDGLGDTRARYVDQNGYLAAGSVRIVGVKEEAFKDTQITNLTLPNSIEKIGDSAFEGSRIENLQFNPRSCTKIGNRAFYNCYGLKGINLTNIDAEGDDAGQTSLTTIGAEAFYGTGIEEIVFPDKLTAIGDGCFAESALVSADFSGVRNDLTIGQYAFFNCNLNGGVAFPTSEVTIDKAAFAVSYNTDDANGNPMETFVFPDNMTMKGDYILAGRTHLRNVTLPGSLNEPVKEGTFRNCERLSCVTLGELSYNGDKGSSIRYGGNNIFQDVENPAFCVQGPGYKSDGRTPTDSRENTIKLLYGLTAWDGGRNVPYRFLISDNATQHIEQIQGDVIVEIEALDESTAQLVRYRKKNGTGSVPTVVVGDDIAGYHITSLGSGCFDPIKTELTELVIQDGCFLTEIGRNALNGASALERVTIGNSVTTIGDGAFANCSSLKDVYFSQPLVNGDDWSQVLTITPGAFRTNSKKLTFHGVVRNNYAPFVYAMDGATAGFTDRFPGKNICYQSLVELPGELRGKINSSETSSEDRKDANKQMDELQESGGIKLIRDNGEGLVTLIDYPHVDKMRDRKSVV